MANSIWDKGIPILGEEKSPLPPFIKGDSITGNPKSPFFKGGFSPETLSSSKCP
jgi:hypothetical protein